MAVPRDILDALECVGSIYFSDVRHKTREVSILSDELVEMCCKGLAFCCEPEPRECSVPRVTRASCVRPKRCRSGTRCCVITEPETRCSTAMQHSPSMTNIVLTPSWMQSRQMEHCSPGTLAALPGTLKVALARSHSSQGNARLRGAFEDAMRAHGWNGSARRAKVSEPPYPVGSRRCWSFILFPEFAQIENILNRLGVP